MESIIQIFRMSEISPSTRIKIIIQLGNSINNQMGSNCTQGLVYELVKHLDPNHKILTEDSYLRHVK